MKEIIQHEDLGTIEYNENFFTGKKSLSLNGVQLEKQGKNTFVFEKEGQRYFGAVSGNFLTGAKLSLDGKITQLVKPCSWYEITLTAILAVFFIVWGNVVSLVELLPLAGGAVGGAIAGLMAAGSLICMKMVKPVWAKILIWIAFAGATLGINYGIGVATIATLNALV